MKFLPLKNETTGLSLKRLLFPLPVKERPEPAVSSQLLVPAAQPGEEGEQRPCHTERHLPQQCHHEVHADQRGLNTLTEEGKGDASVAQA